VHVVHVYAWPVVSCCCFISLEDCQNFRYEGSYEKKQSTWLWTVTCSLDILSRARACTCVRRCQVVCSARLACQSGLTFVVRSVVDAHKSLVAIACWPHSTDEFNCEPGSREKRLAMKEPLHKP
jgi:hypothetical protein